MRLTVLAVLLLCLARAGTATRFAEFVNVVHDAGEHLRDEASVHPVLDTAQAAAASASGHPCNGLSAHRIQQELRGMFSHLAATAEALLPRSVPRLLPGATFSLQDATAAAEEQFQELLETALKQEEGSVHANSGASSSIMLPGAGTIAVSSGSSVEAGSSWKHGDGAQESGSNWVQPDAQEWQDALNRDASHSAQTEADAMVIAVDPKPRRASGLALPQVDKMMLHSDDGRTTTFITTVSSSSGGDVSVSSRSSSSSYSGDSYDAGPSYELYYDDDNNWQGDYYSDQGSYGEEEDFDAPRELSVSSVSPSGSSGSGIFFGPAARDDEAAAAADAAHLAVASSEVVARTVDAIMDAVDSGRLEAVVLGREEVDARQLEQQQHWDGRWEMQKEPTLQQVQQQQQLEQQKRWEGRWEMQKEPSMGQLLRHHQQELERQQEQPLGGRVPWADALASSSVDEQPLVAGNDGADAVEVAAVRQDGSMFVVVDGNTMLLDAQGSLHALHEVPVVYSDSLLQEGPAWFFRNESGNTNWALLGMAVLSAASAATLVAFAYSWMALREAMEAEVVGRWGSGLALSRGSSLDALEAPLLPQVEEAGKGGSNGSSGMQHNMLFQHVAGAR